jgi:RNA polymerase sigma factor (sigma-70 family)
MRHEDGLAEQFEIHRARLRSVAVRMLGSSDEADDAVQEAWLRLHRSDSTTINNLAGWLTTVIGRICLDILRSRRTRREDPLDDDVSGQGHDPEGDAVLADQVGLALMLVLDTLTPDERLTFVLHDLFGVPHRDIALILDRTPAAARMLASRARRRVRGADPLPHHSRTRRAEVVDAFLRASREGDFESLLSLLHPDVTVRADATAVALGAPHELRGAAAAAEQLLGRAKAARPALIDSLPGAVWAPSGLLRSAYVFTIVDGLITAIDVVADPAGLRRHEVEVIIAG